MSVLIPQKERIPGVCYAMTLDGVELPVIDVTHPSFALPHDEVSLGALRERAAADTQRWQKRPAWLRKLMLSIIVRRSVLMKGMRSSQGSFLSGMNTYLLKLSPQHLASSFATRTDRRLTEGAMIKDVRLRLQFVADLLAEILCLELASAPAQAPIMFLNIAGGPAMDTLNALILARQRNAQLATHPVRIVVFDAHAEAPGFGANALAALQADAGPLAGLNVTLRHQLYDWNHPESLRNTLQNIPANAVVLASSEGGILHYTDDALIAKTLTVLHEGTGPSVSFTGSLSPDTPTNRASVGFTGAAVRFVELSTFDKLLAAAGWRVDRQALAIRTLCVRLVKAS